MFWPKDLLSKDLPNSRIITFGYDADIVNFLSPASQNCIGDHARNLLNYVTNRRDNSNTSDRPLLIVAHSLGGLVAEDVSDYTFFVIAQPGYCTGLLSIGHTLL